MPAYWNARFAGKEALCTLSVHGYLCGTVDGQPVLAHRAIWAYVHGAWPVADIDHVNGCKTDNSPENLRDVPHKDNQRNMCRHRSNTSGVMGVNWHKRDQRWRAFIEIEGKSIHLGNFVSRDEAIAARAAADSKYGFHDGHGKVAA